MTTLATRNPQAHEVFTSKTIDGSSEIHRCTGNAVQIENDGTFDGCTITPYYTISGDAGKLKALVGISYTQADVNQLETVPGALLKLVISSAGASTDITSYIQEVPKE